MTIEHSPLDTDTDTNDIAIIGMFCRFPGADDYRQYWQNLIDGKETIRHFTKEELRDLGVDKNLLDHPDYVPSQGVLDDIAGFDASFFAISPGEAEIIDPQHRLFLEGAWSALEDAGYNGEDYQGRIGVFAGAGLNTYLLNAMAHNPKAVMDKGDYLVLMSSDKDYMPTRVSYKLNLKGPSIAVSTACSTSLVAIDLACQSLLSYQSDMALAGGVTLQVPHHSGYLYEEGGTQSKDGHCRAFDAASSGLVGGSGCGVVVLKRLDEALADKDHIWAVIKGSAVNNDGSLKAGYSSPSVEGQAEVIAEAQANADVHPDTIDYIEAHGTGTKLGDPIEIKALTKAFRTRTDKKGYCKIGSVKTNMGHLDCAAGVAGIIKTALSLKHGQIPPSLHFNTPNPEIDFPNTPFSVNTTLSPWPQTDSPKRAGVSSFGIGGTNAHAVLEEAPVQTGKEIEVQSDYLLPLSAKTPTALAQQTKNLAQHLKDNPKTNLQDLAFTLSTGRKAFDWRQGVVCQDIDAAILQLEGCASRQGTQAQSLRTVFLFPGQGAQYAGMGKGLYDQLPTFRNAIDQCADILRPHMGCDIRDFLLQDDVDTEVIKRTEIAQPLLFSVEYALATLLHSLNIQPHSMIGHSLGEYVAATLSGVFKLEDALLLVAKRGQLMQQMPSGAMLGVALSESDILPHLHGSLGIAAINAPTRTVIAGTHDDIAALQEKLTTQGVDASLLKTSHAFHSAAMDGMLDNFAALVNGVEKRNPTTPILSNLSGQFLKDDEATDTQYWVNHLRHCVRFGDNVNTALNQGPTLFIEVGPGNTLSGFIKQAAKEQANTLPIMRHPKSAQNDVRCLLDGLAVYWINGGAVQLSKLTSSQARRIPLPTYPFEHKRYWIDKGAGTVPALDQKSIEHPINNWFYVPSWKRAPLSIPHTEEFLKTPVVLFMDDLGVGEELARQIEDHGQQAIRVYPANHYEKRANNTFNLACDQAQDYQRLLNDLQQNGLSPQRFIHLFTLSATHSRTKEAAWEDVNKGFYSLVFLTQALVNQQAQDIHLYSVTNNLCDVLGNEVILPQKATILGPLRVTLQEHPEIICKVIDVPSDPTPRDITMLWDELTQNPQQQTNGQLVAIRANHRWIPSFEPIKIEDNATQSHLRDNGVYMIAGGLSGIGLELARYLARTHKAKLALTGMTDLPPRTDWPAYLADKNTESRENLHNLLDLDVTEMETQIRETLAIRAIEDYPGFVEKVNRLCSLYICRFFKESTLETTFGVAYTRKDLFAHFAIQDKFKKLFTYILKVLEQDDFIKQNGNSITFLKDPREADAPDALHQELENEFSEFKPIFDVFKHSLKDYAKALSGEIEAVGVLFPEGGESIWDKATKAIPEHTRHRVYTSLARDLVLEKIAKNPERTVRILELGAGAGVFTDVVLPALKGKNVEYTFTDIGKSFVLRAERKAQQEGLDFMKFGLLDISEDPIAQGFDAQGYDIILELDCVHATTRMKETMVQVKKLLAPDGMLLFVESVITRRWMNLPLGLLEGWWYFEDEDLRQDSPLITLENWEKLLADTGFSSQCYPESAQDRLNADCGLIIGEHTDRQESNDPVIARIQAIKVLESYGSNVLPLCTDIADQQAMERAISLCEDTFGPLNGFIQTAAFENRGPILTKTKNEQANEFLPKINGTLIVDELLGDKGLDFIMLSSSHSAYDVGAGDVEYCASNNYVDSFAAHKAREGKTPVIAVNWERWRHVGMAKAYEKMMEKRLGHALPGGMSAQQGQDTFAKIMSLPKLPAQIVVSTTDFNEKICQSAQFLQSVQDQTVKAASGIHLRPTSIGTYIAPQSESEKKMAVIWQDVLGLEQIGITDNFYDLGGDSLIAIKVLARLRESFAVELSVNDLFERPTIQTLCERVDVINWTDNDKTEQIEMEEGAF